LHKQVASYADLTKTSEANLKLAISCVHHAINETAASSVFSDNTDALFKQAPSFKSIQTDLNQFFALSNQVFFTGQQATDPAQSMQWLKRFANNVATASAVLSQPKTRLKHELDFL